MSATRDNESARIAASSIEGEMGARVRMLDWSGTPVGPMESWPQSLRGTSAPHDGATTRADGTARAELPRMQDATRSTKA